MTADQAKRYFICNVEGVRGDILTLVAYVTAEVGKGRPFNMATDSHWQNIDPTQTVYPIRGELYSLDLQPVGLPGDSA